VDTGSDERTATGEERSAPSWLDARSAPALSATVALAVVVAVLQRSLAAAVLSGLLVLALVPCALIDLERRIIPNRITGPAAVLALIAGTALDPGGEVGRIIAAVAAGGFLLLAALIRPGGMGMGDVKLTGVIGLYLGAPVAVALFAALIASVLTGVGIASRRGVLAARKTALPLGPYLAAGGVLAALVGHQLLHAYLSVHR
jgi:leader peptidase (prepilin peptidase)/N-methyltransferase